MLVHKRWVDLQAISKMLSIAKNRFVLRQNNAQRRRSRVQAKTHFLRYILVQQSTKFAALCQLEENEYADRMQKQTSTSATSCSFFALIKSSKYFERFKKKFWQFCEDFFFYDLGNLRCSFAKSTSATHFDERIEALVIGSADETTFDCYLNGMQCFKPLKMYFLVQYLGK